MGRPARKFYDFLGRRIKIGDTCVYIKRVKTGSSTIKKVFSKGVVTRFTRHKVVFDEDIVYSKDVVVVDIQDNADNTENKQQ